MEARNIFKKCVLVVSCVLVLTIPICLIGCYHRIHERKNRVLMIALDGASWKILTPLLDEGKLPHMKYLIENGCAGRLRTLKVGISRIIWATIITGKSPQLHGIIGNLMVDPYTNDLIPPTTDMMKARAIWNILSERNKRVGIIGYCVDWPAEKVNGIMVSSRANGNKYSSLRDAQPPFSSFCSKKTFASFLKNPSSFPVRLPEYAAWGPDCDRFLAGVAEYVCKKNTFDFFCLYLRGIDTISHFCWGDTSRYKDAIPEYYIWCDGVIGNLLKRFDKNTTVIILSDHGFMGALPSREPKYFFPKVDDPFEAEGVKMFTSQEPGPAREHLKQALGGIQAEEDGGYLFGALADEPRGLKFFVDKACLRGSAKYHILLGGKEYDLLDAVTKIPLPGNHDVNDAVIIISGKNIRKHQRLTQASVYDIAPTLLYLSGLPVARDMQGSVLTAAVDPKFLKEEPPVYIDTYENGKKATVQKPARSPEEEAIVKEQMRSLGYIN